MTAAKHLLLGILMCAALANAQLAADANAQAKDIQDKRDAWCGISFVADRNYNASQRAYYRVTRQSIYSENIADAFLFYQQYDTTRWIQTMRWATGLLLVLIILSFISWVIWLGFCCAPKEKNRSHTFMQACQILSWFLFICFLGLFTFFIIFIAFSEVSQRRSKCQVLNIGSMLVNGYYNSVNGNQFVGLRHIGRVLKNLQAETGNLLPAVPAAQSIMASPLKYWADSAMSSLNEIYSANWLVKTVGPLRQTTQSRIIAGLTPGVTPYIQEDFSRLTNTAYGLLGVAQAVPNLGNNGFKSTVDQTIGYLVSNVNSMTADVSDLTLGIWNRGWTRYTFATGAYWAIFAVSIVLIILIGVLFGYLGKVWTEGLAESNHAAFKTTLGIAGFFLVWYGILVIILLAGSTSIATFCTVLGQVNEGKVGVLDSLPTNWETNRYGLSRLIIKQCVSGSSGNLLSFANTFTNVGYNTAFAQDIQNMISGLVAYKSFNNGPIPNGSPSLAYFNAQLNLAASGAIEDGVGVMDQDQILSSLIAGTGQVNAVSQRICGIQTNSTNCLNDDVVNSFAPLVSSANASSAKPYYDNLQAYILSEQSAIAQLQAQMNVGVNSASNRYNMTSGLLQQQLSNYNTIVGTIPGTMSVLGLWKGGLSAYDCRNIRRELFILEDHLCFELNWWVNVLVIISAISFCVLFILLWALFSAARHAPNDRIVATIPEPAKVVEVVKEDPALDINDREIIPSM